MNKEEFMIFAENFFNDCLATSRKKNADYTGEGDDPFANFTSVGSDWTEIGFYTRMMDKMARIRSFIQKGVLEVKEESVTDTLEDLAMYSCLFAGYLSSKYADKGDKTFAVDAEIL